MKKPLLLLLTGGTIGSTVDNGIIHPALGSCLALDLYKQRYGQDTVIETVKLMDILSENLRKEHWVTIVNYLLATDLTRYSGVILTHGSDTLSYSSAFLGICLSGLGCPVVLTAADRVPDDPQSNAVDNLRAAVLLLQNVRQGVYTVYRNPEEQQTSIWRSTRLQEADRFRGRFTSPDGKRFGWVENDRLVLSDDSTFLSVSLPSIPSYTLPQTLMLPYDVLMVQPYPGIDYRCFVPQECCRAVLHLTYHSSSASTQVDNSALTFLLACREKGLPFYLLSFPKERDSLYETSHCLLQQGAIPLPHMTKEAAYAKLLLAVNVPEYLPHDFLQREVAFEQL